MVFPVCICVFLERSELEEVRWPVDLGIKLPWVGELQAVLHVGLEPHALRRVNKRPSATYNPDITAACGSRLPTCSKFVRR